mmetsp:Transcript_56849/g.151801  ORF Transcript_56849/g.151801 Transcript_56849/m.151801 type:complete len:327 (-) Transcript_56849:868-1848(-)
MSHPAPPHCRFPSAGSPCEGAHIQSPMPDTRPPSAPTDCYLGRIRPCAPRSPCAHLNCRIVQGSTRSEARRVPTHVVRPTPAFRGPSSASGHAPPVKSLAPISKLASDPACPCLFVCFARDQPPWSACVSGFPSVGTPSPTVDDSAPLGPCSPPDAWTPTVRNRSAPCRVSTSLHARGYGLSLPTCRWYPRPRSSAPQFALSLSGVTPWTCTWPQQHLLAPSPTPHTCGEAMSDLPSTYPSPVRSLLSPHLRVWPFSQVARTFARHAEPCHGLPPLQRVVRATAPPPAAKSSVVTRAAGSSRREWPSLAPADVLRQDRRSPDRSFG